MRYATPARIYIATTVMTGVVMTALVMGQAWLISRVLADVISHNASWETVKNSVYVLLGVFVIRGVVMMVQEALAHRASSQTIAVLREKILRHAAALGPRWQSEHATSTVTLVTRGIDDLEPYFTRYIPQLILASTLTPALVLVMATQDIASTIAVVLTIPLIPIFMILIGKLTQKYSEERLVSMQRLGDQMMDLVAGLPTLKALGRENGPAERVRTLGKAYNSTTMATLRVAFLSGAVLEFLTTLSVAIVAVEVGFRLLFGRVELAPALFVIMVAPEIYQPLRQVGFHFHASANGVAAAAAACDILDLPIPEEGTKNPGDLSISTIVCEDVSVKARGMWAPYRCQAIIKPGEIVALTGASGVGKTTLVHTLLGLLPPDEGRIYLESTTTDGQVRRIDLADVDKEQWHSLITWVPQRPVLFPGTVAHAVLDLRHSSLSWANLSPQQQARASGAADIVGVTDVINELPEGWDTHIGYGGVGLSVGQRQRVALAQALVSDAPLVILDEPTAHLDARSESLVGNGVRAIAAQGRTVIVIAHRQALLNVADTHIAVHNHAFAPEAV
ncbi:thiol reductant ABC exporter subunit CydD [Actinomyces vulturis]|uniref:thiol reductant ABC exporter subunit CydD n=1 Tax=Actinomyces vulturis TaxID=1857645 RepID=UPI00082AD665|nr:thiol reductant ABC exporter subunit CydD [Actinomyces vulturis]